MAKTNTKTTKNWWLNFSLLIFGAKRHAKAISYRCVFNKLHRWISSQTIFAIAPFPPCDHSSGLLSHPKQISNIEMVRSLLPLFFSVRPFYGIAFRTESHLIYLVIQNDHNAMSARFFFVLSRIFGTTGWDMQRGTAYWHEFNPFAGSNNQHFWSAWLHVDAPFFTATKENKKNASHISTAESHRHRCHKTYLNAHKLLCVIRINRNEHFIISEKQRNSLQQCSSTPLYELWNVYARTHDRMLKNVQFLHLCPFCVCRFTVYTLLVGFP